MKSPRSRASRVSRDRPLTPAATDLRGVLGGAKRRPPRQCPLRGVLGGAKRRPPRQCPLRGVLGGAKRRPPRQCPLRGVLGGRPPRQAPPRRPVAPDLSVQRKRQQRPSACIPCSRHSGRSTGSSAVTAPPVW